MNNEELEREIGLILRYDEFPPSEDHNPYDYGQEIAARLDDPDQLNLIRKVLQRLPSSMAESILEGLLDFRVVDGLRDVLFESLPDCSDVGTASLIVGLLRERCQVSRLDLVLHMAGMLHRTDDGAQDRYAYAIYVLAAGGPGLVMQTLNHEERESIQQAIKYATTAKTESKYTREILLGLAQSWT